MFCQAHAFEVLTPTLTYRQFIICWFYLWKFNSYKARFFLQISYPAILFIMLMEYLNRLSFITQVVLPGTRKVLALSVISFPPGHTRSHRSAGLTTV